MKTLSVGQAFAAMLLCGGALASAQEIAVRVTAPVMGLVAGQAGGVRALIGVPGQARFGPEILFDGEAATAQVAPGGGWAVVLTKAGAAVVSRAAMTDRDLLLGRKELLAAAVIDGTDGCGQPLAFSPSGAALVLSCATGGEIRIVRGMPDQPVVQTVLPDESAANLPVLQLAINDAGDDLLMVAESGKAWRWTKGAWAGLSEVEVTAAAYPTDGAGLLYADARSGELRQLGADATAQVLLAAGSGPGRVSAIAVPPGQGYLLLLEAVSGVVWKAADGVAVKLELPAMAERLQPLGPGGTYLIAQKPGEPAWILRASGSQPSASPVPAAVAAQ